MARKAIQLQGGIGLNAFLSLYGTERQCFDTLYQWRWAPGFVCPYCGHHRSCQRNTRKLQQCHRCHRQTSMTAGTLFDSTKLPLTVWFQGLYFIAPRQERDLGDVAAPPARHLLQRRSGSMRHNLMQVMMEHDRAHPLGGWARLGAIYLGGERSAGKRDRGAPGKTPFVAAVERAKFRWANTLLGHVKNALRGTYHAVRPKYAQRSLTEFEYRFDRRFDLPDIIPRLVYLALSTPPMPEWLLKWNLA